MTASFPSSRKIKTSTTTQLSNNNTMPFLIGRDPIRRTLRYLKKGKLIFKDNVKIVSICYNKNDEFHKGTRDFMFWDLCHIQYKNPNVQIVNMRDKFPTPFIRCWFDTGDDVIIDCFGKNNVEILNHLIKILGKTDEQLQKEKELSEVKLNPANFGSGYERHCLCEIMGQVPCASIVHLPKYLTRRYRLEHGLGKKNK